MQTNRPLLWRQGQFLTPQHMQSEGLFHEWCRQRAWQLGHPYGWGVAALGTDSSALEIDADALLNHRLEIRRLELVTRDGLILQSGKDVPRANTRVGSRDFKPLVGKGEWPMGVYIGLPEYRPQEPNISLSGPLPNPGLDSPRFQTMQEPADTRDLFDRQGLSEGVDHLIYNLVVIGEWDEAFEQVRDAIPLIRIAEVEINPNGPGLRSVPTYIPPCLSLVAAPVLLRRLDSLRELLSARSAVFSEVTQRRPIREGIRGLRDVLGKAMLSTINRYIPVLHHLTETRSAHPEEVYRLLREMIGAFSAYSDKVSPNGRFITGEDATEKDLSPYDHDDLRACFDPAFSVLRALITDLAASPEMGINLYFEDEFYQAKLQPDVFESPRTFHYLMIESDLRGNALWDVFERSAKIANLDSMERLRTQFLPGVEYERLDAAPRYLPEGTGACSYARILTDSDAWDDVRRSGDIAVYCNLDPTKTQMRLFAIQEEE